ncbi:cytochrome-c peroxidase [Halioxenophilus aromaticivorans]|uniref:Cytochrome-c peroxidase n=1 Tax=Halioxenophilus aromaticivorans TaxID=1306992 RepID=A0AAV3U3N4_9ALTE
MVNLSSPSSLFPPKTQSITGVLTSLTAVLALSACGGGGGGGSSAPVSEQPATPAFSTKVALGEALFNDVNLSLERNQSCATCHNPDAAFADNRLGDDGLVMAVSRGDDGFSLGTRNTPTASYAALTPEFDTGTRARVNVDRATVADYEGAIGGQFVDGRAENLQVQAGEPFLNPVEMNMADEAAVVARILEDTDLEASFKHVYGDNVFDSTELAFDALTDTISEFENQEQFARFNSKYDKFIAGEYDAFLLSKAALGEGLFFSQFTNCDTCHQLQSGNHPQETFTGYEYHNIGVPAHQTLINLKQSLGQDQPADQGLFDHTGEEAHRGLIKVPTLRNVAVTAPYMHNGVFRELDTVMRFYDHFNNSNNTINPETGEPWAAPEVSVNINFDELEDGDIMSQEDIEGLVCFMVALTDEAFEPLVQDKLDDCGLTQ